MPRKPSSRKFWHFVLLAVLVAVSSLALAADPPTLVGRISAAEGQVTVQTGDGEESGNLLNWPVKEGDRISTTAGSRTEFRVGPVAVRLDGGSELDIDQLDEETMHLRLNYGAASVRVRDASGLAGFELATNHGRVVLTEPGIVRVDAERQRDATTVAVLLGTARLEGAGTALTLRAGKRADIRGDDVSTAQAFQDNFDAWSAERDRRGDSSITSRYIPSDVTGYEDLDSYGSWTVSDEYGPLWAPRSVATDWAPYRDGRWAWVEPWGWTWVDNAPWGYAPFHYGRWVTVNNRWCWSPGRFDGRPVWAPALVGWVGGAGWSVGFSDRRRGPGLGWYPLTPRDRFEPHYHVSPDHERRLGWRFRGNENWRPGPDRREGITIVPREQFEQRRSVRVRDLPRATVAPNRGNLPLATAPVVPGGVRNIDRNRDGVPDRAQIDRNRYVTPGRVQVDRNRDGIADRLQADRNQGPDRGQDRNRDGTPDRLQVDRNRDGIVDRSQGRPGVMSTTPIQTDRNRDGIADRPFSGRPGMSGPIRTDQGGDGVADRAEALRQQLERQQLGRQQLERQQLERQQLERQQLERQQADRNREAVGRPDRNNDGVPDRGPFRGNGGDRSRGQPPVSTAAPVMQAPAAQAVPQPSQPPSVRPSMSRPDGDAGGEQRRAMMQERMQARQQQMEQRREMQMSRSAVQSAPAPAPAVQPRPEPPRMEAPRPAPMQQGGGRERGSRVEGRDKGQERQ